LLPAVPWEALSMSVATVSTHDRQGGGA
jgi:hypothetical protein